MKIRFSRLWLLGLLAAHTAAAAAPVRSPLDVELQPIVDRDGTTIVHTWAPWCPNCHVEMRDAKWATFIEAHPEVNFVFVEIWNDGKDSATVLQRYGLGDQPNFQAFVDPNPRRGPTQTTHLLDQRLTWVPSTWVYQRGRVRYAMLYGEVRFDMLEQMVADTATRWNP